MAKLARPRTVQELLKNLHVVWTDWPLVEPNFYNDSILKVCFNGTSVVWKDLSVDPAGDRSNRVAELQLDARVFPQMVVRVRLYRQKEPATNKSLPYFPAHQHYIGYLDLAVKGLEDFTWAEVTHVFGSNAASLSLLRYDAPPDLPPLSNAALMRYSYPGDNPEKFGYLELPQTKFWLSRSQSDGSSREESQGADNVTRIFMLEAVNSTQGEE